jgi:2-polyprenyl-3-methyl-5-hydroxy-6-metoxy-1,4-benzoquinol methylase
LKEALLEPLLRVMRASKVLTVVERHPECRMLDIGCGWDANLLRSMESHIKLGVGIDFKAPQIQTERIKTSQHTLESELPFEDESFDVVTMLAVLEHLDHPVEIVREIRRVLVPGGHLAITVPSRAAKPVLEFLAHKLKIVSETEIRDHKAYYDYRDLVALSDQSRLTMEQHFYFQLGMNNFCLMRK